MTVRNEAVTFRCGREWLVGVVSRSTAGSRRGVLLAVGGPQYRVGSHRQFTLLARHLAEQGMAVLRFDYGGMGDSTGELKRFDGVQEDMRAAVDAFFERVPGLRDVVIWGLCDAASAALFYGHADPRVSGLVLLNPWVRTAESEAKAYLKHYYWERIWSAEPWRKLLRGETDVVASARGLAGNVRRALSRSAAGGVTKAQAGTSRPLSDRMAQGLERFAGPVLLILSGNDLTAKEFMDTATASTTWRRLLAAPRVTRRTLPEATHTFSRRAWRDEVAALTSDWVHSW